MKNRSRAVIAIPHKSACEEHVHVTVISLIVAPIALFLELIAVVPARGKTTLFFQPVLALQMSFSLGTMPGFISFM